VPGAAAAFFGSTFLSSGFPPFFPSGFAASFFASSASLPLALGSSAFFASALATTFFSVAFSAPGAGFPAAVFPAAVGVFDATALSWVPFICTVGLLAGAAAFAMVSRLVCLRALVESASTGVESSCVRVSSRMSSSRMRARSA
jgi:hypothetical protein